VVVRYELLAQSGQARRGRLHTSHGIVDTPVFMPVGTTGAVKALTMEHLQTLDAPIILGNTYHLFLRPGHELVRDFGGLHKFIGWPRAMLTDSGGFQVFSLSERRKISEDGVEFRSHLDGKKLLFTPESVMDVQMALGADIVMAFDECPDAKADRAYLEASLARTTRWEQRCKEAWNPESGTSLFGIVQGATYEDLRRRHADEICALDLPGYALGGFAVGESPAQTHAGFAFSAPLLPKDKPRYVMGVGTLEDLVRGVEAGVDMFDCVLPTRCARNGLLFTRKGTGRVVIKNLQYARDEKPIDPECGCYTCQHHTRAYLRHLFAAGELTAYTLNTIHNLWTYLQLMKDMRAAIEKDQFPAFVRQFFADREPAGPAEELAGSDA
jgi:queuine tRNA-ribosyltransferase